MSECWADVSCCYTTANIADSQHTSCLLQSAKRCRPAFPLLPRPHLLVWCALSFCGLCPQVVEAMLLRWGLLELDFGVTAYATNVYLKV
jgi:hypothetical protein